MSEIKAETHIITTTVGEEIEVTILPNYFYLTQEIGDTVRCIFLDKKSLKELLAVIFE